MTNQGNDASDEDETVLMARKFTEETGGSSVASEQIASAPPAAVNEQPRLQTREKTQFQLLLEEEAEADDDDLSQKKQDNKDRPKADQSCCSTIHTRWCALMDTLRNAISYCVLLLSCHAATNPKSYIVGTLVLAFGLAGIGLLTNFDLETESAVGFTPFKSVVNEQKAWILGDSSFPPKPHSIRILIHREGSNVATQAGVTKAFEVVKAVEATEGYADFCLASEETNEFGYGGDCHIRGVPLFWNNTFDAYKASVTSDVDILLAISAEKYPDTSTVEPLELMGHMGMHRDTVIVSAESFLMEILVPDGGSNSKAVAVDVLDSVLDLKKQWTKIEDNDFHLEIYFTDYSLEAETLRAVFNDLPLIPMVFVIMALFTCLVFSVSHRPDGNGRCKQRLMLGLGAVSAVCLSMITSYGLLFIIGVPFTSITQILPFIMFGIGLDDAYVIFGEYIRTDEKKDPVERIQDTFEEVGLSIFLTTVTTSAAFALGSMASLPTLFWLSLYAFPTVLINFVYMISYFIAIVVIDERRLKRLDQQTEETPMLYRIIDCCLFRPKEERGDSSQTDEPQERQAPIITPAASCGLQSEEDIVPMLATATTMTPPDLAPKENTGAADNLSVMDDRKGLTQDQDDGDDFEEASLSPRPPLRKTLSQRHQHVPGPPASVMDRAMRWYAKRLLTKPVKIFVLISFAVVTIGLAVSASKFTQEFNIYEVLTADSYVAGYFFNIEKYADRGFVVPEAYFRNVNQSDPIIQQQMEDYVDELTTIDAITSQPPFFWLRHFKEMLEYDERFLDFSFNLQLDIFLSVDVFKTLYGDHIVRDPETGDIVASRCVMYMDKLDFESVDNQIQAWKDQLDVTEEMPINSAKLVEPSGGFNFFLYEASTIYVWEFYNLMVGELILASIAAMCSVTVVTFLFLPHWSAVLFLSPVMAILYIDLIGFLQLCGVHLNGISYFTIVMSIGLLVDFNMHILLRYYESPCATRDNKVKDALQTMGSSVVIGGISTFLGVVPLLFSTSVMMKSLFYGFWGMVILGILHGVVLLPVLLSFLGPIETVPMPSDAMTPYGLLEAVETMSEINLGGIPETSSVTVSPSDSSARPHVESESDLSDPSCPSSEHHIAEAVGGASVYGSGAPSNATKDESVDSPSNCGPPAVDKARILQS